MLPQSAVDGKSNIVEQRKIVGFKLRHRQLYHTLTAKISARDISKPLKIKTNLKSELRSLRDIL
jgi:hypothetical protein